MDYPLETKLHCHILVLFVLKSRNNYFRKKGEKKSYALLGFEPGTLPYTYLLREKKKRKCTAGIRTRDLEDLAQLSNHYTTETSQLTLFKKCSL